MNKAQAIAKLSKLLGKNMGYRINKGVLKPEDRPAVIAKAQALRAKRDVAREAKDARYRVLMKDPEYVRLTAEHKAIEAEMQAASYQASQKAITVGVDGGMFFSVTAEGDNWQEVIDLVEKRNG